jgi:hypothetical protein
MDSTTLLALGRAVSFDARALVGRHLEERGLSAFQTFAIGRYAFIPALIWCLIFVRPADLQHIISTPHLLLFVLATPLLNNIQEIMYYFVLNSTSSMSALFTLQRLISLPLLLLVGTVFNHDTPSIIAVASIVLLVFALLVQPAHHKTNTRPRYSLPLALLVIIILAQASLEAVHFGMMRGALLQIDPADFVGLFLLLVSALTLITHRFMPYHPKDRDLVRINRSWIIFIIVIGFVGSICEMYAQAKLPIYTLVSIGAIAFALNTASDLLQKRTKLNLRTVLFMALVLTGMGLAIYSV